MNDETGRPATLPELQARALKPLIDLMAASLLKGGDLGRVLLEWLESAESEDAISAMLPEFLNALQRATAAR